MIQRIVDFSLDNRLLVLLGWLLVVIVGIKSLRELPIDAVPDVTNVQVQVLTDSPGLAPEEVESFITFPVETAMSGLPKVDEIRSVSKFGLSVVTVVFEEGTDIYLARQLVNERLSEAREQIPQGYGEPKMGPISTGLGEIYQFEVRGDPMCKPGQPDTADCYTPMELRTILDWNVAYQLRSVKGIVEVNSFGGELRTYQATLDMDRLVSYGLTVGDVLDAIERNNENVGGGYIAHQGEQVLVRGEGLLQSLTDIERVVVNRGANAAPIYVRDVARVDLQQRRGQPAHRHRPVDRRGVGNSGDSGAGLFLCHHQQRRRYQGCVERPVRGQPAQRHLHALDHGAGQPRRLHPRGRPGAGGVGLDHQRRRLRHRVGHLPRYGRAAQRAALGERRWPGHHADRAVGDRCVAINSGK